MRRRVPFRHVNQGHAARHHHSSIARCCNVPLPEMRVELARVLFA